ncbi:MAG TPA: helix-turn-helix domain-containing protein [Acidothermaceae bacterium]|jgi:excisionase family DNA binding protein
MESLLTADEVAAIVRCGARKVLKARQKGEIAGTRIGHGWAFSEAAVEAWVARNTTPVKAALPVMATLATRRRRQEPVTS